MHRLSLELQFLIRFAQNVHLEIIIVLYWRSNRHEFYVLQVKDSDGKQLDSTINKIKIKQANSLTEWELEHPDFIKDPKLTDEWCSMMAKIAPESKNDIPKIKRSFAKYFEIKEAMKKAKN